MINRVLCVAGALLATSAPAWGSEATKMSPPVVKSPEAEAEPAQKGLAAPTDLMISEKSGSFLTLVWQDNSDREFGAEIWAINVDKVRSKSKTSGKTPQKWKRIVDVQERVMDQVEGTGLRSESEIEYAPSSNTCFRVRSYFGFDKAEVSAFSNTVCTRSDNPKTPSAESESKLTTKTAPADPASEFSEAPSNLLIEGAGQTDITIRWTDNSSREFGVEVYRIDPAEARKERQLNWTRIFDVSERISDNVTGSGERTATDTDLTPGKAYCYRVRAYFGFDKSEVSDFSNVKCGETLN